MTPTDLAQHPDAFLARSRPVVVTVRFARAPGTIETLEGPVRHAASDAIVTGVAGENWPVAHARFAANYDALAPTTAGEDGRYAKRTKEVWALCLKEACTMTLTGQRGQLHAQAGDFLVQYASGDCAIVAGDIFARTYE